MELVLIDNVCVNLGFEVLGVVIMKIIVFWETTP
jgi:hypothetical protein